MSLGVRGASIGLSAGDQVSSNLGARRAQMQFEGRFWAHFFS
jgi:hypothetical protein